MSIWSVGGKCRRCGFPLHLNTLNHRFGRSCGRLYICYGCGARIARWKIGHHGKGGEHKLGARWQMPIRGTSTWRGRPLVLELHHDDGDHENERRDNLSLQCPNCHSQTPNYKNRKS